MAAAGWWEVATVMVFMLDCLSVSAQQVCLVFVFNEKKRLHALNVV